MPRTIRTLCTLSPFSWLCLRTLRQLYANFTSTQSTYVSDVSRVKLGMVVKLLLSSFRILVSCNRDVPTQENDMGEDGPEWDPDAPLLSRGALIETSQ